MRVLKISHSGVVAAWRERERRLISNGVDITMVTAARWDEGGRPVSFEPDRDSFATPVRTWGTHPNVFLFDPRPLWHLLSDHWDVIDINEEPCSLATAEILAIRLLRRLKTPIILYSAQNIAKHYPPPFCWTERWALKTADAVSVCNSAAGRILRWKGLQGQIAEIPLGVDTARFCATDREPPLLGRLRVGYVGRLAYHKGVHVLINAVAACPAIELNIVGSGPEEPSLKLQALDLGISPRLKFLGSLDQAALPDLYRSLDAVVVPSINTPGWEEQFCRVAAEAMASGVPVVVTRSGSLPEVVSDAGLVVEPNRPDLLRDALTRLAHSPKLWTELRQAGLRRADKFEWRSVSSQYKELYEATAGDRNSPSHPNGHSDPSIRNVPLQYPRVDILGVAASGTSQVGQEVE